MGCVGVPLPPLSHCFSFPILILAKSYPLPLSRIYPSLKRTHVTHPPTPKKKFPSLHTIEDPITGRQRRYDAEYTITHPFPRRGKTVLISVLIDASRNIPNARFQDLLDRWEEVDMCTSPSNDYEDMDFDCAPYSNRNRCERAREEWLESMHLGGGGGEEKEEEETAGGRNEA